MTALYIAAGILLLLAALLPAIILLVRVYRMDKIEKEPRSLLWKLVAFGALAGLAASVLESAFLRRNTNPMDSMSEPCERVKC